MDNLPTRAALNPIDRQLFILPSVAADFDSSIGRYLMDSDVLFVPSGPAVSLLPAAAAAAASALLE